MNFQVDLFIDSERRSASAFNMKAVARVLSIVGPAAAVLAIALVVIHSFQVKLELERLQTEWSIAEPKKAQADSLRNQVSSNQRTLRQLKGIAASDLPWHAQLEGLLRVTPPDIQLRKLTIQQTIGSDAGQEPVRVFSMILEGKASGPDSDQSVEDLKNSLLSAPVYSSTMETANVVSYGLDTSVDAARDDRAFRIDCRYVPKKFE